MGNIAQWLRDEEQRSGQPIQAVVVDEYDGYDAEIKARGPLHTVLSREQGLALLDYEHDHGYGGMDCHHMTAWSADRVYYVSEYDGSTSLSWQPGNPPESAE